MNGVSAFSFSAWVRFETVDSAQEQYLWSHRGATNQVSMRKVVTSNVFRWSVTCGGVAVFRSGLVPTAGQLYHVAGRWAAGSSFGMEMWVDGTSQGTTDTTAQVSVDYDSGDATTPLCVAARTPTLNLGRVDLENLIIWGNFEINQNEVRSLRYAGWPVMCGISRPLVQYLLDGGNLTYLPDLSGNGRHITDVSGSPSGPSDQGTRGKYEAQVFPGGVLGRNVQGGTSAPPPNPFTFYGETNAPDVDLEVAGLTDGIPYEFYVTAIDASLNESAASAIVEATPQAGIVATDRKVFLGH